VHRRAELPGERGCGLAQARFRCAPRWSLPRRRAPARGRTRARCRCQPPVTSAAFPDKTWLLIGSS
jgi:hypothetical protein